MFCVCVSSPVLRSCGNRVMRSAMHTWTRSLGDRSVIKCKQWVLETGYEPASDWCQSPSSWCFRSCLVQIEYCHAALEFPLFGYHRCNGSVNETFTSAWQAHRWPLHTCFLRTFCLCLSLGLTKQLLVGGLSCLANQFSNNHMETSYWLIVNTQPLT